MIVNVRGTHGTGKTTVVRRVMEHYPKRKAVFLPEGRRLPIGYICKRKGSRPLFVPGSYEHPITGGCDNIPKVDLIYGQIRKYAKRGFDVLYEGIVAQHSTPNIMQMHERGMDVHVVVLDLPIKKALKGVKSRRKKRGETKPFNPLNTEKEGRDIISSSERLRDAGVPVRYAKTRKAALARTLTILGLA